MTTYFTADTHFCHSNILKFCQRGFVAIDDMNEGLIEKWNLRVGDDDDVFVLGDFSFRAKKGTIAPIFRRLKGKKHLIIGNHDNPEVIGLPWNSTPVIYRELRLDAADLILSHYPMRSWNRMYHGSVHLFGHTHGHVVDYQNACDVGVDNWNYEPVTLDEIKLKMQGAAQNPDFRH